MEILVKGEGSIVILLIDRLGRTIMQEKLTVSGPASVHAKVKLPFSLDTTEGNLILAPILLNQSNPNQKITFDGQNPNAYAKKRFKEIGVSAKITKDILSGKVKLIPQSDMTLPTDDKQELNTMFKLVKSIEK